MVVLSLVNVLIGPALVFGGVLLLGSVSMAQSRAVRGPVGSLLRSLTLDEKLSLLHGADDPAGTAESAFVPGVPRLDIPPLRITEGPPGGDKSEPATVFPARIQLGATFAPDLAFRAGRARAREARARGQDVVLSSGASLVRVPQSGGNGKAFSEDPRLTGGLLAEEVKGIEEAGMISVVKHYPVHHFKHDRHRVSIEVGERTLRELYLPAFRRAIEAGVGGMVASPNRINGTYAADHERLLTDVLKEELAFGGWVMTDWFGRHSLEALEAGLDQEMPGLPLSEAPQATYFAEPLRFAVERGHISKASVDDAVRRILRQMHQRDRLRGARPRPTVDRRRGGAVAREVAESGAVLLQNENDALPLSEDTLGTIAVIAPPARRAFGGRNAPSQEWVGPLAALQRRMGSQTSIRYEDGVHVDGVPIPSSALSPSNGLNTDGLRRATADGAIQIDPVIDFTGEDALPGTSSWTWSGTLTAPQSGSYTLVLQTKRGEGQLWIDEKVRASTSACSTGERRLSTASGLDRAGTTLDLEAGESYAVTVTVDGAGRPGSADEALEVRLAWVPPARRDAVLERAVSAARTADATVVFGFTEETYGEDRSTLSLPEPQDDLIEALAETSAPTIVVLNTGGAVQMPWIDEVEAVLEMWYPGDEGGEATAALLTGAANPSGHLPVTFPRTADDTPTYSDDRYPGVNGTAHYTEGVFVGYRWYDERGIDPLFPFGHGRSYTTFSFSKLSTRITEEGRELQFRVRNSGDRAGIAVPQVYVGRPADPPVAMPPKALVGFDRVELAPQETATISIPIERRALSYWSVEEDAWRVAPGRRPVYVGMSSRDVRLEGALFVE